MVGPSRILSFFLYVCFEIIYMWSGKKEKPKPIDCAQNIETKVEAFLFLASILTLSRYLKILMSHLFLQFV